MQIFTKILLCTMFSFGVIYAQKAQIDDTIDESYIHNALSALIFGKTCEATSDTPKAECIIIPPKGTINVANNATIDTTKYADAKMRFISFNGEILHGGIYDATQKLYFSADKKFSYRFKSESKSIQNDIDKLAKGTLEIKFTCKQQSFTITNFSNGDFGLNLSKNPTKEVAIVLNVNNSMWRYTNALKDIAPYLAKHIFGKQNIQNDTTINEQFAKISLITFSYVRITDLGTFYDEQSFTNALGKAKGSNSRDNIVNVALVEGMRNFTKDNGLKKEIYLITNGASDDPHKEEQMLSMTKNLNANIVKNTTTNIDNRVKIHIFALKPFSSLKSAKANAEFLQNLAKITGGTYNEADNTYNFKKQILTISNNGKPFDMRELNNEIHPSKSNKIYDPDNPNNKPKKK